MKKSELLEVIKQNTTYKGVVSHLEKLGEKILPREKYKQLKEEIANKAKIEKEKAKEKALKLKEKLANKKETAKGKLIAGVATAKKRMEKRFDKKSS